MSDSDFDPDKVFTPDEEEQTKLVLEGKCPHNKGWRYMGHGHNDEAYECKLCKMMKFY
jgi:hypothetical protein